MTPVLSRRDFLRATALTAGAFAVGMTSACSTSRDDVDARDFLNSGSYYIAHRGSGDEAPEHTLSAYTRIVDAGAQAVEISVHKTRDGVLVCHHDPTLERTCDGFKGAIKDLDFAQLQSHPVDMSRYVGPSWKPEGIPFLDTVLDRLGNRAVLFIEPKDPTASDAVIAAITARKLTRSVVYKQALSENGDVAARAAGLAVWNYYDTNTSIEDVHALASRSDAIGAEANREPPTAGSLRLVDAAVATGRPVIAWAVHRRSQVDLLRSRGVRGFMAASWTYLAADAGESQASDHFGAGRVTPGDLSSDYTDDGAPTWNSDGSIGLAQESFAPSLSMGSMRPASNTYTLTLDMSYDALPSDRTQHAGIVIGRRDDAAYRFGVRGADTGSGVLVILRANGSLEIRAIPADNGPSQPVRQADGAPVVAGRWESLQLKVDAGTVTVSRTHPGRGPAQLVSAPVSVAGDYFSLTRNYLGPGSAVRFRNLRVTTA